MKNDWLTIFAAGVIVIIFYYVIKNSSTAPAPTQTANQAASGNLLDQVGASLASILGSTSQGAANIGNALGLGTSENQVDTALNLGSGISNAGLNPAAPEEEGGDFLSASAPAILNPDNNGAVEVGASQAMLGLDGI